MTVEHCVFLSGFRANFFILVFIEHLLCDKVQGLDSSAWTLGLFLPLQEVSEWQKLSIHFNLISAVIVR